MSEKIELTPERTPQSIAGPEHKKSEASKPAPQNKAKNKPADKKSRAVQQPSSEDVAHQREYEKAQIRIQEAIADYTFALVVVGAIIGFFQIVVMFLTYFVTGKAAKAAEQSAIAANRQVTIFVQNERPWITVRVSDPSDDPNLGVGFGFQVNWTVRNVGRIPAFLTELIVHLDTLPADIFRDYPPYPAAKPFAKFIIPPNGEHGGEIKKILDARGKGELWEGSKCLVFFGRIKYHMEEHEYITRFCSYWHWEGPELKRYLVFEPVGPPEWIEYT